MDRKEAIHIFVKDKIDLFLLDKFPFRNFKKMKGDFFLNKITRDGIKRERPKGTRHYGIPKSKEIAEHALYFLIENGAINDQNKLDEILRLPFFKKYVHNSAPFKESLEVRKSTLTTFDVKELSDSKIRDKVKQELKKEIIEESTEEIQKAIQNKKHEYMLFPSVLDEEEYAEPEIKQVDESTNGPFVTWWKKLNLKSDPFPEQSGLTGIAKDMYEDVVYKTPIFRRFVEMTKDYPTELLKTRIFLGDFGSGKTTLFDYLEKPFLNVNIFNVYIMLYAEQDFQSLLIKFRNMFYQRLCKIFKIRYQNDPELWIQPADKQTKIQELLNKLVEKGNMIGLIVFIDDLHKNKDELPVALKFINNLQIIRDDLIRNNPNLKIAFNVSGLMESKNVLENDPQYSGSYTKYEILEKISPEDAYEMLNKRLVAFAENPNTVREISLKFVKKVYRGLPSRNEPITFRSFIKAAINEFEKGNFSILTADPIRISENKLNEIRKIIESNNILNERFKILLFGGGIQNVSNRERTIRMLIKTHLENGLTDSSEVVQQHKFEFQRLARSGLIQKVKSYDGLLKWVVCEELIEINQLISKKFNLYLEDYLTKIYIKPKIIRNVKKEGKIRLKLKRVDLLIKNIKEKKTQKLLKLARTEHKNILEQMEQFESKTYSTDLISQCVDNLALMTKTIATYFEMEIPYEEKNEIFLRDFYRDFWFSPSPIAEFINQISDQEDQSDRVWVICNLYKDVFDQMITLMEDELRDSQCFKVPIQQLSNKEVLKFRKIRKKWMECSYFEVAELTTDFFEPKFKNFMYNIFSILYGKTSNRLNRLDKSSRDYIFKNMAETKSRGFNVSRSEFDQLNRGNFKNFVIGLFDTRIGKKNWNEVFSHVFNPLSEKDICEFLSLFAEINIIVSHRKKESINSEHQRLLLKYVLTVFDLTKKMNKAYHTLCQEGFFIEETPLSKKFRFSFANLKDFDSLDPIRVTQNNAKRVYQILERLKINFTIDLEDKNTIETYFHTAYREFYAILSRLIGQSKDEIKKSGISVTIQDIKGSSLTILVKKIENKNK